MRKLLFLLLVQFAMLYGYSQKHTISGKITDEKGNPIPVASIIVKGTNIGTVADSSGIFFLAVPTTAKTLVVSSLNFITQEVPVSDLVFAQLKPSSNLLSEVVVVGYGQLRKTNLTGSLTTVKGTELENKPFSSPDKSLQGAVAGLQASSFSGAPGSATDIIIRGFGSITADASPLWVIDGAIVTPGDLTIQTATANTLSSLNPDDIESITVLKDAATASIYGSRAANGVILVTTKKGKSGKTRTGFSMEIGKNSIAFNPSNKPLTTLQNQTIMRESLINAGYATNDAEADAIITDPNGLGIDPNYTQTNTNWLDVVSQKGSQQQYNLSLSGGDAKTQFYASGGYFKQIGTVIASDFTRYNGNLSVTHKASDQFTFYANINGAASNQNTPNNGGNFSNPVLEQFFLLPWYSPYNSDGSFKYNDSLGQFSEGNLYNPVIGAAWNKSNVKQTTIRGSVSGEYRILDNLKFTSRYSAEYLDINEDGYLNPLYGDGYPLGGGSTVYHRYYDWTWSNFVDYRHDLGKNGDFYFDLKAGYEAYQQSIYQLAAAGNSFPNNLSLQYLSSAAKPISAYSNLSGNSTTSLFSVADINYKDRYILSGSYRRDASSRFGANHKWANFYSVGAAWNINEEDFLKDNNSISLLKLRTSYGKNGNQAIGDYTALATFGYGFNYTSSPGSQLTNVGNPDLTWEKNAILNIGFDFGLWKSRFYGTIDYYQRTTSDLILAVQLSRTSGVGSQNRNIGAMTNNGIEITLGGKPIVTRDFVWDINANFSHNKNTVTKLYLHNAIPNGDEYITEGHDFQEYYMQQWAGVNTQDGTPQWYTDGTHAHVTGNYNEANPDYTKKSAAPKYFGSFNNSFTYKGLSLQVQFYYNFGNYIDFGWGSLLNSEGVIAGVYNQLSEQLTAWQKPGDKTNIPQIIYGGNNNSTLTSTRFLYKGDYIRLRNIQIGYAISSTVLQRVHIASLSIYLRGTNLFTYAGDKNLPMDPEAGVGSGANLEIYHPKTITGGIKIEF